MSSATTLQAVPGAVTPGRGAIRPPYRFVEGFRVLEGGAAETRTTWPEPWPAWASAFPRTALPIEWGAQLYGARIRVAGQWASRPAYLAGVKEFRWAKRPVRIVRAMVMPAARRGGFHEFTAGFFSGSGTGCAWMTGALYFPGEPVPAPEGAPPATAGAGVRRRDDGGKAPFRVISEHTGENGYERRIEPNPACPVYAGHFPGEPIVPGVLMLEAMVEAGRALVPDVPTARLYLAGARDVVFRSLVRPGDALLLKVEKRSHASGVHEFLASMLCHGKRVAGAKFSLGALGNGNRSGHRLREA